MRRMLINGALTGALGALGGWATYRWFRTWGATFEEQGLGLPGDELCLQADVVHTRAITIGAPPAAVWPWLSQIGQDRGGFFSYTRLENLCGCRMPQVHELRCEWDERRVGERILLATPEHFGGRAYNVVARVERDRALVAVGPDDPPRIEQGRPARWVWQFVLEPGELSEETRLLVRSRYGRRQLWLEPIHFVMERRMMLTIARLAEQEWMLRVGAPPDESDRDLVHRTAS